MKNQMKLVFIFLLSFSIEKITIKRAINYGCNLLAINELYIEAESDEVLINDKSFQLKLKGNNNYNVICSLLANNYQSANGTETDDENNPFNPINDDDYNTNIPYLKARLLDETSLTSLGSCQIEGVKQNETFLRNNISNASQKEDIDFNNDFNISVIRCTTIAAGDKIESKLPISFRQINGYDYIKKENKIIFSFYGIVSEDLPKGYIIKMTVNLIKNMIEDEDNPKTAICLLKKGIDVKGNEPVQGDFSCTIENITDNDINSFVLKNSSYFAGIPEDNVLLNPKLTEQYIVLGKLIDYSIDKNKEKAPSFNTTSIDSSNCKTNGTFVIKGVLTSNLNNDLQFELPFVNPENITATCTIKSGKKNQEQNIDCKTNGEFDNEKIMIAQNTILDNNKKELLIISKIEAKNEGNCSNAKTQVIIKKLEIATKISFRQVNHFYPIDKKTYFNFIGISDKSPSKGRQLNMLVFIIINGKKVQKEANCELNSFIPFNSLTPNYGQVNYICKVQHDEYDKAEDLEIISSDDILGLNDDLEDYQKSPNKTDKMIEDTKKEPSLGKVLNFSSTNDFYDIPPTLEISSVDFKNCKDKGKIKVTGKFNQKIEKKFDFTIPLSYPSSSIKCTAPNIQANINVDIDCKIQKDFYDAEQFIIEPRIIKKKHQEVIFIKNYTYNNKKKEKQTCYNYNTIQKKIEEQKQKMKYTFLQTNNFMPLPSGLFFRILIYSLTKDFPKVIPLTISIRRRMSNLRNLDEIQEEDEVKCIQGDDQSSQISGYNCTSKIKVNDASEFEDFSMESKDVPGLYEDNSNPILTDNNIKAGVVPLISKDYNIGNFDSHHIEDKNCTDEGTFNIVGDLNNIKDWTQLKNLEVHYSNPPDSHSVCNFISDDTMECHNAEEFEGEYIIINKQSLDNGALYFTGVTSDNYFTCKISSFSVLESPIGNNTEIENRYFTKKKSSGGLSGGSIAAIVIISAAVLIGLGVLIALIKNGIIFSSEPKKSDSNIPPISSSSANII